MGVENFEIVTTTAGAVSIRNKTVNEIMHNPVGPWAEANALYVEQPALTLRFAMSQAPEFVLFDVGLGAASNAVAALHALRQSPALSPTKRVRLISFENDLSLLEFALIHADAFSHYRGFEEALSAILVHHRWQNDDGSITWELRRGDFPQLIGQEQVKPAIVFYDPYSPGVNPEMWNLACFRALYRACQGGPEGCTVYTYSVATRVRAALLAAGFYVGYGTPTGLKEETTQAATRSEDLTRPLDAKWIVRLLRSHSKMPSDVPADQEPDFVQSLENHPQFSQLHFAELRKCKPNRPYK